MEGYQQCATCRRCPLERIPPGMGMNLNIYFFKFLFVLCHDMNFLLKIY